MPQGEHTLLFSIDGDLLAFGSNSQGQLGLGHSSISEVPTKVPWKGPKPVQVDWGSCHSLVLDEEGGVWETGRSRYSQPFTSFQKVEELPCITSVSAGDDLSTALGADGALWVWASESVMPWACSVPQKVEGFPPLIKVAAGDDFIEIGRASCRERV